MLNLKFEFDNAWLLLLLIPAVAFTFLYYFRLNKKYRKNRNRITSMVLHLLVMFLTISVLAGMTIKYDMPNKENEVMLVVDLSNSNDSTKEQKDRFIQGVIDENSENFKVGIVTFGYDQVYAAELSYDADQVYQDYLDADLPDDSATNIAAALNFAREQFNNPEAAKIVLITDGVETDGNASTVIKSIAAEGIRLDTVYFQNAGIGNEVQIIQAVTPDYSIKVGDEFGVILTLESSFEGSAEITVIDNDEIGATISTSLKKGTQEIEIKHSFALPGLHKLTFKIECGDDNLLENNLFNAYIYMEVHDKILIVERTTGESSALNSIIEDEYENIKVANIADAVNMPKTLDDLRAYDQVILMNISNYDMQQNAPGFIDILHSYVYDIGGGVLTVGGNKTDGGEEVANMYNRSDLLNSTYQKMLPVQAVEYTPPLGVIIIIDRSGSMGDSEDMASYLGMAKEGALSALNALTDRDYCGIYTLEEDFSEEIPLTSVTRRWKIEEAIYNIKGGGGTEYSGAIDRAGSALTGEIKDAAGNVVELARRHIVLVSDGQPSDDAKLYNEKVRRNFEKGVTFSMVCIGSNGVPHLDDLTEIGNGRFYQVTAVSEIATAMRGDLEVPSIKETYPEEFQPKIAAQTPVVQGIKQDYIPNLGGFYGTKAKDEAQVSLLGSYKVPIYAQWKYGKGAVGSFMCDLNGNWSGEFMSDETGIQIIRNIISGLFPTESIQPQDIELELEADNYTTKMSVYTKVGEKEHLEVTITGPGQDGDEEERKIVTQTGGEHSRISFEIRYAGVYEILVEKMDEEGNLISSRTIHKAFSYSDEYDCFYELDTAIALVESLAKDARGEVIEEPYQVYRDFKATLTREYDPKIPFIIAALIFLLGDIAVRKFKFKWPHELIREYKKKKEENK